VNRGDAVIEKYTFSGHDSFQCRQLWLKKGFDFVREGYSFNDESAVVKLGVGKNMVSSIRYWLKAFNIIDSKDELSKFGISLFDDHKGYDPYLEDEGSLWLLHYQLVSSGIASSYSIIFNEFRKEKVLFKRESYLNYLKRRKEIEPNLHFNENTVADDFDVFVKMYQNNQTNGDVEDSFSGILSELELLRTTGKGKSEQYQIENMERDSLPPAVLLFSMLENHGYGKSISLNSIENEFNSPGSIFAINRSGLLNKINELVSENKSIVFTDHAGIKELQFKKQIDSYDILSQYYEQ
jgi:hypothetical protein